MARREQENKVLFGFSDLYIGTYTVDDATGDVTLGTPYHQTGAVGWSPEGQGENYTFYIRRYFLMERVLIIVGRLFNSIFIDSRLARVINIIVR